MATLHCNDRQFNAIQAVIFDKDGTLANSANFLRNLGQRRSRLIDAKIPGVQEPLLMAFGLDNTQINPSGLLAVGTRYENEIAAAAYVAETGRDWAEALEIVHSAFEEADRYMKRKADETPLFDHALPLLQALNSAQVKVGILSSDTTANVQDFVQAYGLTPYIQLQMGCDRPPSKPDPILIEQACAVLEVPPEATLMIGDSAVDMQMAHAARMAGRVGVSWGWPSSISLAGAEVIVHQFDQIQVVAN